jgi:hypothetical protein
LELPYASFTIAAIRADPFHRPALFCENDLNPVGASQRNDLNFKLFLRKALVDHKDKTKSRVLLWGCRKDSCKERKND